MRTSENQSVYLLIFQLLQVTGCNLDRNRIMQPSFFYQRYKKRTCFTDHRNLRIQPFQIRFMNATSHRTYSTDHTNSFIVCLFCCHTGTCLDHTDHRYIKLILYCFQCKRTCSITGDHDRLDILFSQKMHDLTGIANDGIF